MGTVYTVKLFLIVNVMYFQYSDTADICFVIKLFLIMDEVENKMKKKYDVNNSFRTDIKFVMYIQEVELNSPINIR